MPNSILIVEDEDTLRGSLARLFTKEGFFVDTVDSAEAALEMYEQNYYDVIISDIILPGMDGIELLSHVRKFSPSQIFIIISAYGSLDTAVRALRVGAYDYIMKPIIHAEIKQVVHNAIRQGELQKENQNLKRQLDLDYGFSRILGSGGKLKPIIDEIRMILDAPSSVMLLGETGTGKGLFARVIHYNSNRAQMPFVPINCSAIPETLLESELFGHVKGAFTGAVSNKAGLFDEANGGTVFLDEIGEMPVSMQVKLLKTLEDQQIRPVGSTKVKKIDVRIITATNKDLAKMVEEGEFRRDLYYRINVIALRLPSLKERPSDIPELAAHYVAKYASEFKKDVKHIHPKTLDLFAGYEWPGNIRELQNVLERAVLIARTDTVQPELLPESIIVHTGFAKAALDDELSIDQYTRHFVQTHQDRYSETEIAEKLGITRKTLWEKRKKWDLKRVN